MRIRTRTASTTAVAAPPPPPFFLREIRFKKDTFGGFFIFNIFKIDLRRLFGPHRAGLSPSRDRPGNERESKQTFRKISNLNLLTICSRFKIVFLFSLNRASSKPIKRSKMPSGAQIRGGGQGFFYAKRIKNPVPFLGRRFWGQGRFY